MGWDEYSPRFFIRKRGSQADFKKTVKKVIKQTLPKLYVEKDMFIDGYDLMELMLPLMEENGFKRIFPAETVTLLGGCLYRDDIDRPDIFTNKQWKDIIAHNKGVDGMLFSDDKAEGEE